MEEIQLKHVSLWKIIGMSTQVSACSLAQIPKPKITLCKLEEEQTEDLKNELKLELIHSVDYILREIR
ncbi:hypothetical protein AAG906_025537 [Vitis piasezkii]